MSFRHTRFDSKRMKPSQGEQVFKPITVIPGIVLMLGLGFFLLYTAWQEESWILALFVVAILAFLLIGEFRKINDAIVVGEESLKLSRVDCLDDSKQWHKNLTVEIDWADIKKISFDEGFSRPCNMTIDVKGHYRLFNGKRSTRTYIKNMSGYFFVWEGYCFKRLKKAVLEQWNAKKQKKR